ncbi:mechanosensitive ion channel family protein [Aestuariispira insulae]|uniref:Mechanosensitive ion channel-like protein n=1 Tax=Aestuariispira insulae TaxID=1461337 RepID=A0A3D9HKB7_9PROT|nr:mechanosensitive ion channel domain-containing protein [Aestuariispira insulae]RED49913.1 mechanosensitive ion channel-like protein [Aestuariispira insulae]
MELPSYQSLQDLYFAAEAWFVTHVLTWGTAAQAAFILLAFGIARLISPAIQRKLKAKQSDLSLWPSIRRFCALSSELALPALWLILQLASLVLATAAGFPPHLLDIVASLLTAWVVVRFLTGIMRAGYWSRVVAFVIWSIAALDILDLLEATSAILDDLSVTFGDLRLSALSVVKGLITAGIMLWIATSLSKVLEQRLRQTRNLSPSLQVLSAKLAKVLLFTVAILAVLSTMGIDLTAFAVFGGAIGVGVGFGLQKVVSNLISGVILLLDRSIKPGDVIEVGQTYGRINSLGARYASVVTRDGMEYLIPNEDLITQRVVNWSFSSPEVRLKVPIGISYDSDVNLAIELAKQAAHDTERVLDNPKPTCLMMGFGDSSIDLELRFWIEDPANGLANMRSAVLLKIWEKYRENDISIPYPHREVILRKEPTAEGTE